MLQQKQSYKYNIQSIVSLHLSLKLLSLLLSGTDAYSGHVNILNIYKTSLLTHLWI